MPSTTYVARRPGPFSALVQASEIGGLRLDPHPPARALDRYYDTDDAELLRRGLTLRVREQGEHVVASLRPLDCDGGPSKDLDLYTDPTVGGRLALPPSALADTVRAAVGEDPLRLLLTLRQYRTPRMAYYGETPVGVVSFDVVVYEGPGSRIVSNEVDVEPTDGQDPMAHLRPVFVGQGLERASVSKVERGLLHLTRTLSEPVLLLPSERQVLEDAMSASDSSLRRRAHVVLLDSRGFRPDTIATQTGLSMARVRHWRERFREVRLEILTAEGTITSPLSIADGDRVPWTLRGPAPLTPPPVPPLSPVVQADAVEDDAADGDAVEADTAPPHATAEGDGLSLGTLGDAMSDGDLADLLDLFEPRAPDTPFLDGDADLDDDLPLDDLPLDDEPLDGEEVEGLLVPSRSLDPYPVVLGPVQPAAVRSDPFAEVDLSRLRAAPSRSDREASRAPVDGEPVIVVTRAATGPDAKADGQGSLTEESPAPRPPIEVLERPRLPGATPLLVATETLVRYAIAGFDRQAGQFLATRAPSDARRLLVAAHSLRLLAETFEAALPERAVRRLVTALRPLVASLDEGLDAARGAAAREGDPAYVRRATAALADAAACLASTREAWGARARRLVARLATQSADGALRSDDAPLVDDFVGEPGDAPSATRLRHVLGSAVWTRYEAVRAFEDDLGQPTTALASHLAVTISGLRYVIGLVESSDEAARSVTAALAAAERAVVDARQRVEAGDGRALDGLAEVWRSLTEPPFRARPAAVVAAV